jgi:hypothetical protein
MVGIPKLELGNEISFLETNKLLSERAKKIMETPERFLEAKKLLMGFTKMVMEIPYNFLEVTK